MHTRNQLRMLPYSAHTQIYTYVVRGLWLSTRPSYRTHTPNTVIPVSFTSIAQVPNSRLSSRDQDETVGGALSPEQPSPTLLKHREGLGLTFTSTHTKLHTHTHTRSHAHTYTYTHTCTLSHTYTQPHACPCVHRHTHPYTKE